MHDINVHQSQDIIYDSIFEVVQPPQTQSSTIRRRHTRERLEELNEQRELQRLIKNEWD